MGACAKNPSLRHRLGVMHFSFVSVTCYKVCGTMVELLSRGRWPPVFSFSFLIDLLDFAA